MIEERFKQVICAHEERKRSGEMSQLAKDVEELLEHVYLMTEAISAGSLKWQPIDTAPQSPDFEIILAYIDGTGNVQVIDIGCWDLIDDPDCFDDPLKSYWGWTSYTWPFEGGPGPNFWTHCPASPIKETIEISKAEPLQLESGAQVRKRKALAKQ